MVTKITNKQIKIISPLDFNGNEITNALINANNNTITNLATSDLENDSGFVTSADVNSEIIASSSTLDNVVNKNSYKAVTNDAIAKGIDLNKVSVVDSIDSSVEPLVEPTGLNQSILKNTYYDKEIYTSTYKKLISSFYTQTGGTFKVNGEGKIEGFTDTTTITKYFQNWGGVKSLKLVLTLLTQTGIFSTPIFLITRHDDNSVLFGIDLEGSYAYQRLHFYTKQRDSSIVDEAYCKVSIKTSETGGIANTIFTIEMTSSGYIKLTGNGKTELIRYFNSLLTSDNVESDFYYNLDVDTTIKSTIAIPNINPPGRFGISQLFGLESYIEYNYMSSQGKNYIVRSNNQEFMWNIAVPLQKNKLIYNIADDSLYKFDNTLTKILSNVTYTAGNGIDITNDVISLQDSQLIPDQTEQANKFLTTNGTTTSWSTVNYNDLTNKPTIGNATLTIQKNSTNVGTFTANSVTDSTINISVPTNVSDLNNDSDYQTETEVSTLIGAHNTSTTAHSDIRQDISGIEDLIPAQATISNKLADKDFVNSSVATNTANFIETFENVSALNNYSGTVTNNDYAFVINSVITNNGNDWSTFADLDAYTKSLLTEFDYAWVINGTKFDLYRFNIIEQTWGLRVENTTKDAVTLNTAYNRYKATVNNNTITWNYEYTLNNSSFTANQWAAINSGITSGKVSSYDNHLSDTNNPHSVTKSQVGLGNVDDTSDLNKPISTATQNALNNKQDLLIAGNGITISNSTISLTGTTQLADNTDIDTVLTEGNYFIKNPTSTKGMPELPVSSTNGTINYWIALLLVEKEYGFARYIIRQTITLSPVSVGAEVISQDTLMFTRTLSDYARVDYRWTKIDGDITNLNFNNPQGDTLTVNNLYANYCYRCQYSTVDGLFNTLSSLTLTNIQDTADEIRVMFKTGNNFTLTATQLTFLNYSNIVWETNKIYVITIKNLYATIDAVGDNPNLMNLLQNKENISNKVTSINASSTDTEYPTAKCVYDLVGDIESVLDRLITGGGVTNVNS